MSRKDEILRKIEELEAERRIRKDVEKRDRPVSKASMDCSRMPLGCWILLVGLIAAAIWAFKSFAGRL